MRHYKDVDNLPKGLSYPVKRSVLDAALEGACPTELLWIHYYRPHAEGLIMDAGFIPDGRGIAGDGHIQLIVYAVPAADRPRIAQEMSDRVLPALVRWIKDLQTAGNVWRGMGHDFTCSLNDKDELVIATR